jgi:hypothetical protein
MTIITYYDDSYTDLGTLTSSYLEKYCKKHNYKLVKRNEVYLKENRPSSWAKIKAIQEEFEKTEDWIFWIDCDAIITNYEINLNNLIDENFDAIFSTDGFYTKGHFWPSGACFLIKKTNRTLELLDKIWNQPKAIIDHCWWEQMALAKTINENAHLRSCYKMLKYKEIFSQIEDWNKNDFIMHIGGGLKLNKEKHIKMLNFIKYNNINV